jgi:hypothetical protein
MARLATAMSVGRFNAIVRWHEVMAPIVRLNITHILFLMRKSVVT